MTSENDSYVVARFRELTDDELVDVVGKQRNDYTERAIELARVELSRRQIDPVGVIAARALAEKHGRGEPATLGTHWLGVYAAIVGASAVGGPLVQLATGGVPPIWVLAQLPGSVLGIAVAYGILKRRSWGWYLNWLFLALLVGLAVFSRGLSGALGSLTWGLLNAVYFVKRRALFVSGGSAADSQRTAAT